MQRELSVKIVLIITTLVVIGAMLFPAYAGGSQIETDSAGRQIVSQNPGPDPVTTDKILDGTIQARDMSPDFIEFQKLYDTNSGHGWDPMDLPRPLEYLTAKSTQILLCSLTR
jgi:hypothetical protein